MTIKLKNDDGLLIPDPNQEDPGFVHVAIAEDGSLEGVTTNLHLEDAVVALQRAQLRLVVKGIDEDPDFDETELIEGDAILRAQARDVLRGIGDRV